MLLITFLLGLFFIVGAAVVKYFKNSELIEHISIAVALGAMIGIACFDITPEILEMTEADRYYLPIIAAICGFVLLAVLDKFIPEHEDTDGQENHNEHMEHIGVVSSVAVVLHNIIEGMAVYSIANTSPRQGIALMFGIGLHNIPMGMFLYSTLRTQSRSKCRAFMALATLSTFIGGLILMVLNPYISVSFDCFFDGMALGMIVFIVIMELFPFVRKNKNRAVSVICTVIGLALVLVSTFCE